MVVNAIDKYIREKEIGICLLSEKTGLTEENIQLVLKGKRKLSLDEYEKICIACDVPYEYFFDLS